MRTRSSLIHLISLAALFPLERPQAQSTAAQQSVYNAADVEFMQGMMHHHAQAIVMSALAPTHTRRKDIRAAARRIVVSQRDEIAMMRRWLERRGQTVPVVDTASFGESMEPMPGMNMGVAGSRATMMPGMMTPKQLRELAASKGAKFDRLFLSGMVRHHRGALAMVAKLFGTSGATQDAEIFQLASDIDSDQRAEIARMLSMLPTNPVRSR